MTIHRLGWKKIGLYGIIFTGIYNSKQIWYGVGLYGIVLHKVGLYGGGYHFCKPPYQLQ